MKSRGSLRFWCAFLLWWMAPVVCSAQDDFEYGVRPPNSVFDPHGLLDPRTLARITEPLPRLLAEENIDVIVVVLEDLGGAPPEFVARRFSDAWCNTPAHAVVLHVPGNADSPWIVPGGPLVDQVQREVRNERMDQARKNARREPTQKDKVRVATVEAADMLRFWSSGTMIHRELVTAHRKAAVDKVMEEYRLRKIRLYVLVGGGILLVIGLLLLLLWWRKPRQRIFPDFHPPRRLGAPHGGGNHVIVPLPPITPSDP